MTVTVIYYLRQVNEVNGRDNVFIRCACVCEYTCSKPINQTVGALNANSSKWLKL